MRRFVLASVAWVVVAVSVGYAAPVRDRKVTELARKAAACRLEFVGIDIGCAAYVTWTEERAAFTSEAAQATLLALLDARHVKLRLLAAEKLRLGDDPFDGPKLIPALQSKDNIRRVLAAAKRERHAHVVLALVKVVVVLDVEKHGLGADLLALLQHPDRNMREGLAPAFEHRPGIASAKIAKTLLADRSLAVQRIALESVARSSAKQEKCKLLRDWMAARPMSAMLVSIAASSRCRDVMDLAIEWVAAFPDAQLARAEQPSLFGAALAHACGYKYVFVPQGQTDYPNRADDERRVAKVIGLASRLAKSSSVYVRLGAIDALSACADLDDAAERAVAALANDRDRTVANHARRRVSMPYAPSIGKY